MADLLACPVCNARVAPGAARCVVCRSSLTGLARPATVAMTPPVYAQPAASSDDDDELATADDTTHQRERFEPGLKIRNRYLLRRAMGDGVLGTAWEARDQHHGAEDQHDVHGEQAAVEGTPPGSVRHAGEGAGVGGDRVTHSGPTSSAAGTARRSARG